MSIAADTSPWLVAVPSALTGLAAIAGGYLAARHQLGAQREERREARGERRLERRLNDLNTLAALTESASVSYVKTHLALTGHGSVTNEDVLDQLTYSTRVYATVARIADDELARVVEEWMSNTVAYGKDGNHAGDPGGAKIRAVHDRISTLMHEIDPPD